MPHFNVPVVQGLEDRPVLVGDGKVLDLHLAEIADGDVPLGAVHPFGVPDLGDPRIAVVADKDIHVDAVDGLGARGKGERYKELNKKE